MSLSIRFLGTSAARPTVERNVSAIAVVREGETLLIDCGEGTQRQMMRYGVAFALGDIFFSHLHADHFLGVLGLVRTMSLQGRTETLKLWGPRGTRSLMKRAEALGGERLLFPLEVRDLEPGEALDRGEYSLLPFATQHGGAALGYALIEHDRKGRFDPDRARAMGIPEGPMWGQLHRGLAVTLGDGRVIESAALVGPARPGRRLVITGDTRPCESSVQAAQGADLLVHEATFAEEEAVRAGETGHSTAREAATVASRARVRQLVLTHFSARYSRDTRELEREARAVFPDVISARDGMEIDIPYINSRD